MNAIKTLHREAMALVDEAERLRVEGQGEQASARLREAFDRERQAAALSAPDLQLEPTRSVLHRSAASLALECGDWREAERLIAAALSGNPPAAIAEELRDLLGLVYFDVPPQQPRRPLAERQPRSI